MQKDVTIVDVERVAVGLMTKNGSTTNLDVKNALRTEGYWAEQKNVATLMKQVAKAKGWHIETNGQFVSYSFQATAPAPVSVPVPPPPADSDDGM